MDRSLSKFDEMSNVSVPGVRFGVIWYSGFTVVLFCLCVRLCVCFSQNCNGRYSCT